MAFDASIDYKAKQNELKKQMEATTDATQKAALQSQYDAYEQSRLEKIASDLTTYGKYADNNELNSAAGIVANNQIGTTYETQKQQLNSYYDSAKQNANNDALSRGMARSSYVSDRLSGLDSDRASGLSNIDAEKASALENARTSILDNYRTNAANELASKQSDARDQINTIYSAGTGTPSDELWNAAGYDPSVVSALKAYQAAGLTSTSGGSYSGSGGTTTNGGDVYDQMYSSGITTPERAYAWLIGQGYTSTEATNLADNYDYMYNSGSFNAPTTPTTPTTNSGVSSVNFNGLIQTVNAYLGAGNPNAALSKVEGMWDSLTAAQRQTLQSYFSERGYTLS